MKDLLGVMVLGGVPVVEGQWSSGGDGRVACHPMVISRTALVWAEIRVVLGNWDSCDRKSAPRAQILVSLGRVAQAR